MLLESQVRVDGFLRIIRPFELDSVAGKAASLVYKDGALVAAQSAVEVDLVAHIRQLTLIGNRTTWTPVPWHYSVTAESCFARLLLTHSIEELN